MWMIHTSSHLLRPTHLSSLWMCFREHINLLPSLCSLIPTLPHTSPHLSWYWMSSNELCTLATSWLKAGMERRSAASTDLREGEGRRGGEYEGNGVRRGWALLTAECIDREGDERQAEGDRHS